MTLIYSLVYVILIILGYGVTKGFILRDYIARGDIRRYNKGYEIICWLAGLSIIVPVWIILVSFIASGTTIPCYITAPSGFKMYDYESEKFLENFRRLRWERYNY